MSREPYNSAAVSSGTRSPGRTGRRLTELPTVDRSPSRDYGSRGSPLGNNILSNEFALLQLYKLFDFFPHFLHILNSFSKKKSILSIH